MTTIYVMDVRELQCRDIYDRYYDRMPKSRQAKLNALRQDADKRRSLGVGILLQKGLKQYGIHWTDENVAATEQGKLYLRDGTVQFNLSHSGDYAVAAFAKEPVGIDIEQCRKAKMNIAKRFFCEAEQELLSSIEEERDDMFFRLWTLKESFLKVNGEGMRLALTSFAMHIDSEGITVEEEVRTGTYSFDEYAIGEGEDERYRIALCMRSQETEHHTQLQWIHVE